MPNDITVTKNETAGSERWDVEYTADQAATVTKTMETAGTMLDRDIKVAVTIPSGSVTAPNSISGNGATTTFTPNPATLHMAKNISVTPQVTTAGYISAGTAATSSVSLSAQAAGLLNSTITPTTTDISLAANGAGPYWIAASAKVAGDAELVAGNIKKNVSIYGVTGTYEGSGATLQAKTNINPTTSSQTITPDAGYDGLSSVQINAMATGSAATPATTITPNAISISVNSSTGVITASNTQKTQSVTPTVFAGYVSSGTAGTITVSAASNTSQLSTQAAATITPTESEQTAVAAGKYTTGEVKVGAISSTYVGSGITRRDSDDIDSVGETGYYTVQIPNGYYAEDAEYKIRRFSLPTATSATHTGTSKISGGITPGTTNQYLNINSPGVVIDTASYYQINGDANLIPQNIADGVTIFNTTGSLAFSTIYTGSSAPSSSTGVDGDIYLQV